MVRVIGTVGALGVVSHAAFIPLILWLGVPWMAIVNVVSVAAWAWGWAANRRGDQTLAVSLMTAEVVVHTILAVYALGLDAGFQYDLFGGIPFALFITKWRSSVAVGVAAAMVAVFIGLNLVVPAVQLAMPYPGVVAALRLANSLTAFAAVGLASAYCRDATRRSEPGPSSRRWRSPTD